MSLVCLRETQVWMKGLLRCARSGHIIRVQIWSHPVKAYWYEWRAGRWSQEIYQPFLFREIERASGRWTVDTIMCIAVTHMSPKISQVSHSLTMKPQAVPQAALRLKPWCGYAMFKPFLTLLSRWSSVFDASKCTKACRGTKTSQRPPLSASRCC